MILKGKNRFPLKGSSENSRNGSDMNGIQGSVGLSVSDDEIKNLCSGISGYSQTFLTLKTSISNGIKELRSTLFEAKSAIQRKDL